MFNQNKKIQLSVICYRMYDNKEEMNGKPGPTNKVHKPNLYLGNYLLLPLIGDNSHSHVNVLFRDEHRLWETLGVMIQKIRGNGSTDDKVKTVWRKGWSTRGLSSKIAS